MASPGWTPLMSLLPWLPLPPYLVDGGHLQQARDELRKAGFGLAEVDSSDTDSERGLLEHIGGVLNFPDYYRPNWDAFEDCVGDLMREESTSTALLLANADQFLRTNPYDFVRSMHLLYSVVEVVARDRGEFRLEVLVFGSWRPDASTDHSSR